MNKTERATGKILAAAATASVLWTLVTPASAAPVTPTFTDFGNLPQATFGGSGIPTDPTAITSFTGIGGDVVTLGLSATPRFANPPLTNDGAGTYTALAGANDGTPGSTVGGMRATWNFSYFLSVTDNGGGSNLGDYGLKLLYDLDPGTGTDDALLGMFDFTGLALSLVEDSQNLTFAFLAGIPPIPGVTAPAFTAFDPNAVGEYSFAIRSTFGEVAINVNTVAPVPLPAAFPLFAAGLGLLGLFGWRRKHKAGAQV